MIVGDKEDFVDTPTELIQSNVFYVNKSFLVHHSRYFRILLDSSPPRDVVRLQLPKGRNHEMFAYWLDTLYQNEANLDKPTGRRPLDEIRALFAFASFLGSSSFKNLIIDAVQSDEDLNVWTPLDVIDCHGKDAATDLFDDYVLESVAYKILKHGWMKTGSDHVWDCFINGDGTDDEDDDGANEPDRASCFMRLAARVDKLREAEVKGKLMDPNEREDCKWHEHDTPESRRQCHRFDPEADDN